MTRIAGSRRASCFSDRRPVALREREREREREKERERERETETETETETDGEVVRGMKHVDIEIQSTTLASASRNDVQRPPTRQERQLMEVGLN